MKTTLLLALALVGAGCPSSGDDTPTSTNVSVDTVEASASSIQAGDVLAGNVSAGDVAAGAITATGPVTVPSVPVDLQVDVNAPVTVEGGGGSLGVPASTAQIVISDACLYQHPTFGCLDSTTYELTTMETLWNDALADACSGGTIASMQPLVMETSSGSAAMALALLIECP